MNLSYETLEKEIVSLIEKKKHCILATSYKDYVTTRSMSIVNIGLNIYFQSNSCYIKYDQMKKNKNVSLCFDNVSIEGEAELIGDWKEDSNKELLEIYKDKHLSSFNAYGMLQGQVVYKVTPKKIKLWKYVDGIAIRQNLLVDEKRVEELQFM